MEAHKRCLGDILSNDVRLVAPLFQRPYVWSKENNWEPLWNALVEVIERRSQAADPRPYFLGALVLDQLPNATGTVPSREIIDGQQRMTTLQLMMQAAKTAFEKHGFEHSARLLHKLTRNDLEVESDELFKIWPTNTDRNEFRIAMTAGTKSGRMGEALTFFQESIDAWLRPGEEGAKDRSSAFVAAVKQDLVFVAIDLDNDDDGQLIFETLNSLGTPLLPSDLVKNLLFREAAKEKLDAQKLYQSDWQEFECDRDFWRTEFTIGRRIRTRLDIFLQYYLAYKLGVESLQSHHFRDYRDAFLDGFFGNTTEAIQDFGRHAKYFKEFDQSKLGSAGTLRHVLEVLDVSVPNPLVLGIYANVPPGSEREAMFATLESYIVRRFLCGLSTKNLNRVTLDLIRKLKDTGWSNEVLKSALKGFEGNSTCWPENVNVVSRQIVASAYGNIRGLGIAYVLSRVEGQNRTAKSEQFWNSRTPLTLEHIMPQKWIHHWPLDPDSVETHQKRNDHINRIGNLTVLTQKLNSSISNGPWETKRRSLNQHSVLLVNSQLATLETWDEDAILARSEELGKRFCEIWPR